MLAGVAYITTGYSSSSPIAPAAGELKRPTGADELKMDAEPQSIAIEQSSPGSRKDGKSRSGSGTLCYDSYPY